MSTQATTETQATDTGAQASQAMFEAMTGPFPKIDTRTPAQVKEQAQAEGWK